MGISDKLISLEVTSTNVPDLTLIDLPGITRIAVKDQPENIAEQVNLGSILSKIKDKNKQTNRTCKCDINTCLTFIQIKKLIKKFITKQETIILVVVPCNVDIATTEALKMAQDVDPNGLRTLGLHSLFINTCIILKYVMNHKVCGAFSSFS